MCGVFRVPETDEMLLRLEQKYAGTLLLSRCVLQGDAYPRQVLPAVARGKNGSRGLFLMQWGFRLNGSSALIINARSETISTKPLFAAAANQRRCLIPMACYYEWKKDEHEKQKFAFTPLSSAPHYLAALYHYEKDPLLPTFTVLTRPAESSIAFIHDRMPVIFSGPQAAAWLNHDAAPSDLLPHASAFMDVTSCA